MRITLDFCQLGSYPVDVHKVLPGNLLPLENKQISGFPVTSGRNKIPLAEIAKMRIEADKPDELVLSGATGSLYNIGQGMKGGCLRILGDAGDQVCQKMVDGEVTIEGKTGNGLGSGMEDGLIVVKGNLGAEAGKGMRRGLILSYGNSGPYTGANLRAGTIMVFGNLGEQAGIEMKRGSLVAKTAAGLSPSFRNAGPADAEWLNVYFCYLAGRSIKVPAGWWNHGWRRFTGDHLNLGKGEILLHE